MSLETLQIRCHSSLRISLREKIADDCYRGRPGLQDRLRRVDRDATNRHHRN